jgi:hypothetical protein
MQATYKIVQRVNGQFICTEPRDIYAWASAIDRKTSYIPDRSARYLRPELRNQPRIEGFCGPMYDGEVNGVPVIRYEDQATNDILSV